MLAYGTAGFRDRYDLPLNFVFARMGVLAALRAISVDGKCVGAVITASHNHEVDNGVKLVDFNGGMLDQQWEPLAVKLVNCSNSSFCAEYKNIVQQHKLDNHSGSNSRTGVVLIGRDTRPHSEGFFECMRSGALLVNGTVCCDLGEVTTPLLHFAVRDMNGDEYYKRKNDPFNAAYFTGRYYQTMADGYRMLVETSSSKGASTSQGRIIVDASYGVGSIVLSQFADHYNHQCDEQKYPEIQIDVRNKVGEGKVNEDCGAEHAQKLQQPPVGVDATADLEKLMCSFDGDGDRIVFHAFISCPG